VDFQAFQTRFVTHIRERVRSGEVTERGLARLAGLSQPHLHNVLKGKRFFSMPMADQILRYLHMDLLDLVRPDEYSRPPEHL
jgi:transcriptional regulator with XRE-family HTH domain